MPPTRQWSLALYATMPPFHCLTFLKSVFANLLIIIESDRLYDFAKTIDCRAVGGASESEEKTHGSAIEPIQDCSRCR